MTCQTGFGTTTLINQPKPLPNPVEVRRVPEDKTMNTVTETPRDKSLSEILGDKEQQEIKFYAELTAKYSHLGQGVREITPNTSKTYLSLVRTYTRAVERSCARLGVSDQDGCLFSVSITPHKSWLMQPTNRLYDDNKKLDACMVITKLIQNECNYHLFKNPRNKNDRFIKGANVVETRDRHGSIKSHHQHGIWLLDPEVAPKFDNDFIETFLSKQTIDFLGQSHKLKNIIDSIEIIPITNNGHYKSSTKGWIEYMFKHEVDQKGEGKWFAWDGGFGAVS